MKLQMGSSCPWKPRPSKITEETSSFHTPDIPKWAHDTSYKLRPFKIFQSAWKISVDSERGTTNFFFFFTQTWSLKNHCLHLPKKQHAKVSARTIFVNGFAYEKAVRGAQRYYQGELPSISVPLVGQITLLITSAWAHPSPPCSYQPALSLSDRQTLPDPITQWEELIGFFGAEGS